MTITILFFVFRSEIYSILLLSREIREERLRLFVKSKSCEPQRCCSRISFVNFAYDCSLLLSLRNLLWVVLTNSEYCFSLALLLAGGVFQMLKQWLSASCRKWIESTALSALSSYWIHERCPVGTPIMDLLATA